MTFRLADNRTPSALNQVLSNATYSALFDDPSAYGFWKTVAAYHVLVGRRDLTSADEDGYQTLQGYS
jgi:hypothetical protein